MQRWICALLFLVLSTGAGSQGVDHARWQTQAQAISITRDDWGIAHIHGKTDADAVFGSIYAQCEDDFNRVETNYLVSLGRLSEAEGKDCLWQDLRQRLFVDPEQLKADYAASPPWLQRLMYAWADGLNFFLYTHPEVHPRVITHFEPWMALSFTEGSIGGDIERVNLQALEAHYGAQDGSPKTDASRDEPSPARLPAQTVAVRELEGLRDVDATHGGSNGFAIAPANTRDKHALLLINPHTSFFFRSELQMSSDEGLDAYGAVTWGQIFVYQGFNDRAGWMHTSSNVDAVDEYVDTVVHHAQDFVYQYGTAERPFTTKAITITYKTASGPQQRTFTVYYDHRGPVVRDETVTGSPSGS